MQFRGKFGAGCSGPDDRDMQLSRSYWIGLRVGTDKAVNEPLVKPDSLLRRIEGDCVLLGSGRSKIVAGAAHRNDERVIGD